MVKEGLKKILPVMQAFVEGKTIQRYDDKKDNWYDVSPNANIDFCYDYRIKPEPNYRSFKNQKECWKEMQKHQPFGWIKAPNGELFCIDKVFDEGVVYKHSSCRFEEYLEGNYTFADGIPFGIKED